MLSIFRLSDRRRAPVSLVTAMGFILFAQWSLSLAARADTITPISISCSAVASDGEGVNSGTSGNCLSGGPGVTSATWPPPGFIGTSIISGNAFALVSDDGTKVLTRVSLSQANNPYDVGLGYASASASLTYYFDVVPDSPGDVIRSLLVLVAGLASTSGGSGTFSAFMSVYDSSGNSVFSLGQLSQGANESYLAPLNLVTDEQYEVVMSVAVSIAQTTGSEGAEIDPTFTILPPYDSQYHLVFSPGIVNEMPTPLPAALWLFMGGLGMIGWLGAHKRRKLKGVWS